MWVLYEAGQIKTGFFKSIPVTAIGFNFKRGTREHFVCYVNWSDSVWSSLQMTAVLWDCGVISVFSENMKTLLAVTKTLAALTPSRCQLLQQDLWRTEVIVVRRQMIPQLPSWGAGWKSRRIGVKPFDPDISFLNTQAGTLRGEWGQITAESVWSCSRLAADFMLLTFMCCLFCKEKLWLVSCHVSAAGWALSVCVSLARKELLEL